jgi:hypothetical protein
MACRGDGDDEEGEEDEGKKEALWIRYRDAVWANLCSDHVEEYNKKERQR